MKYRLPHVDLNSCSDHMKLDGRCRLCRTLVLRVGVVIWMILGVLVVAVFLFLIVGVIFCWCICCYSIIVCAF
jgi:hypothetical protein